MSMPDIDQTTLDAISDWEKEICVKHHPQAKAKLQIIIAKVVQEAEEKTRRECADAYWNNPQMGMAEKGRAILNAGK